MALVVSGIRTGAVEGMRCKVPAMKYALVTAASMLQSGRFSCVTVQDEAGTFMLEGSDLQEQVDEQIKRTPHLDPRRFRN